MESCLQDARAKGKAGVCMLGAEKQKSWLSDQRFAEKFGFQTVDTAGEYRLLAVRFDERPAPFFAPSAKKGCIEGKDLTVYYTDQCPVHCPENREAARVLRDARNSGGFFACRNDGAGENAAVSVQ